MQTLQTHPEQSIQPILETASGWMIDYTNPDPDVISISDIALALSRINRFNGHTSIEWSVASHSILCLDFATQFYRDRVDDRMGMHILLHDAHEAYTGDIVTPLKHMPEIRQHLQAVEARLQYAIELAFGISHPTNAEREFIKMIDEFALAIEAHHLMPSQGKHWSLRTVGKDALDLFDEPMSAASVRRRFEYRYDLMRSQLEFDRKTGVAVA
jgi:hypothetical protein